MLSSNLKNKVSHLQIITATLFNFITEKRKLWGLGMLWYNVVDSDWHTRLSWHSVASVSTADAPRA